MTRPCGAPAGDGAVSSGHDDSSMHAGDLRTRDLLPLPFVEREVAPHDGLSRGCQRRILRRRHRADEINRTIGALNSMFGGQGAGNDYGSLDYKLRGASGVQQEALDFVSKAVSAMGSPPEGLTCSEALRQLRATSGYVEDQATGALAPYVPGNVSLPEEGWRPIALDALWGQDGRESVGSYVQQQLLPADEARCRLRACGVGRPYGDPRLKHPRTYGDFVKRLAQSNLVDFSSDPGFESIALFFVTKKNGSLRMIVDARRSNCHFREPDHVSLCTGEGLAHIEVEKGEELQICSADLKDAFYHLELPSALRPYFTLPPIDGKCLDGCPGVEVQQGRRYYPRLCVVPMGWSWALYVCQALHEHVVARAGLGELDRIQDKRPCPSSACMHTEYVDNLIVLGSDKQKVISAYQHAVHELKSAGLQVHEEEVHGEEACILGWEISKAGCLRPSRKRVWKTRLAIRAILAQGRGSARQLERLVGHMTFISLARRESLSVLGSIYKFIGKHYSHEREVGLPRQVRWELSAWDGLLPLIYRDFTCRWSGTVHAVDASEWGLGVTQAELPVGQVKDVGQYSERWRFKDPSFRRARRQVFVGDEDSDPGAEDRLLVTESAESDVGRKCHFEAIGIDLMRGKWRTVGSHRWRRSITLPVAEARATLYAVKHILRSRHGFGQKHLIFSDSMTAACAIARGRSPTYALRRVCQQVAALALCSGSSFHLRWVPSEYNPADNPSRGVWCPSEPREVLWSADGDPSRHQPSDTLGGAARKAREEPCQVDQAGPDSGEIRAELGDRGKLHRQAQPCEAKAPGIACRSFEHYSGDDCVRGSLSVEGDKGPLCQNLDSPEAFGDGTDGPSLTQDRGGAENVRIPKGHVHGRRGHRLCPVHSGCAHVLQSFPAVQRNDGTAESEAKPHGLETARPGKEPAPHPLRGSGFNLQVSRTKRSSRDRVVPPGLFHAVSSPLRRAATEGTRCGSAQPHSWGLQLLDVHFAPSRDADPLKDSRVRRVASTGSRLSQRGRECTIQGFQHGSKGSGGEDLQVWAGGSKPGPRRRSRHSWTPETGSSPSLPSSSWRSLSRLRTQTARPGQHPATWTVEVHGECSQIPERSQAGPALQQFGQRRSKCVPRRGKEAAQYSPKPALSFSFSDAPVFLEICSGSERLGKVISRQNSWPVLLWNIQYGAAYDLKLIVNQWKILGWIRASRIRGVHFGTLCNSFSRARDYPPGPPPLRSDEQPLGLSNLETHDARKVRAGNVLMRFLVKVFRLCHLLQVPCTFASPATSRIWICPPVAQLLRAPHVRQVTVESCRFGTPWRKSITFLSVGLSLELLDNRRCLGPKRGLCQRTALPHVPLNGTDACGRIGPSAATPCPVPLCRLLAQSFMNHELSTIATQFELRLRQ